MGVDLSNQLSVLDRNIRELNKVVRDGYSGLAVGSLVIGTWGKKKCEKAEALLKEMKGQRDQIVATQEIMRQQEEILEQVRRQQEIKAPRESSKQVEVPKGIGGGSGFSSYSASIQKSTAPCESEKRGVVPKGIGGGGGSSSTWKQSSRTAVPRSSGPQGSC